VRLFGWSVVFVAAFLAGSAASAQDTTGTGSLSGSIRDASGTCCVRDRLPG